MKRPIHLYYYRAMLRRLVISIMTTPMNWSCFPRSSVGCASTFADLPTLMQLSHYFHNQSPEDKFYKI
ncbi:hypothetical protein [Yersinia pestis]|uniref:hypothetical protein n=1 Tax=Yersinia pestis TaxID=632 RepID=UPI00402BB22C